MRSNHFFFTEQRFSANVYFNSLTEYVEPQMDDLHHDVEFQQDGPPLHLGDSRFGMSRDDPIPWPPRSPDVTMLEYIDNVHKSRFNHINDLKTTNFNVVSCVKEQMLKNTREELLRRL